ncbi:MAG: tRNA pseudouridine(13) synthase TruD [Planctomycetaceae bacterium]|nr:tRNA pseudouridine(13) synthase TruD [Planctomycetaceae bacterium]
MQTSLPSCQSLPYLTPSNKRIVGRIKSCPEDFVVEEVSAYEPSGTGGHLYLWIEKRDCSADLLLRHLARELRLSRDSIGMAGLKDRYAVTRQWVSVPASSEKDLDKVDSDLVRVLKTSHHTNKLRTGHVKGNHFEIIIRSPDSTPYTPEAIDTAQELAEEIRQRGFPNFFGEQRFGKDDETLHLGLGLLRGGADMQGVPFQKRKFLQRLALSAAQSCLFNRVLAQRLQTGTLHQVLAGDVMQVSASGGVFNVEDVEREQPRYDGRETVLTGPLFGPKMKLPTGLPGDMEQAVLDEMDLTLDAFREHRKLTPGARRPMITWPRDLEVSATDVGLKLTFFLPSGSYATVLLREFLKDAMAT